MYLSETKTMYGGDIWADIFNVIIVKQIYDYTKKITPHIACPLVLDHLIYVRIP